MAYPFQKEIQAAAARHGLDPNLVAAIVSVESCFQPQAVRYEAKFQKKYIDPHPKYGFLDAKTRTLLSSSLGLMQTMGLVAHEDGLSLLKLEDLFRPEIALEYGCKQLKQLIERYWQSPPKRVITNAIAAYNAGTARVGKAGKYVNQGYVDKVWGKFEEYKKGVIS